MSGELSTESLYWWGRWPVRGQYYLHSHWDIFALEKFSGETCIVCHCTYTREVVYSILHGITNQEDDIKPPMIKTKLQISQYSCHYLPENICDKQL